MDDFLNIDEAANIPLYIQIYQRFHEGINSGQLKPLTRVPSIRVLASELNVARGTVELAYQLLISEGLLVAKGAKGTFITEIVENLSNSANSLNKKVMAVAEQSAIPKHNAKSIRPFQLGIPALDAFPIKLWSRLSATTLRETNSSLLGYPDPQGLFGLREELARYLVMSRGINCTAEQIFISSGYRSSLMLIVQSLLNSGDIGWFEEPGYHIARSFLQHMGIKLVPISVDDKGINVEQGKRLAPDANFALVTPTHQSPTNISLSLERRIELLDWANKNKSWIIEDDYDGEFRYQGRPLAALKKLDKFERVIYCGTMSKALFPALRLSYVVVPTHCISQFYSIAEIIGNQCSVWQQEVTYKFFKEGHFSRHLRKMRNLYRQRRQILINVINDELSSIFKIEAQAGGMHIVVELINGQTAKQFSVVANKNGLSVESLDDWCIKETNKQILLLGFTNICDEITAYKYCQQLLKISAYEQEI